MFDDGVRRVQYIPRSEWGSSQETEEFITNRYSADRLEKVCFQVHHTAAPNGTQNTWSIKEAVGYMRRLQWVRPDLGPLPYSMNLAVLDDPNHLVLFEGRGLLKVGAHTRNHNRHGIGLGIFGNFDLTTSQTVLDNIVWFVSTYFTHLKGNGFVNLGNEPSPKGWLVWGHRDSATKSCPGSKLYPLLENVRESMLTPEEEKTVKEMHQALTEVDSNGGFAKFAVELVRKERKQALHDHEGEPVFTIDDVVNEVIRRLSNG